MNFSERRLLLQSGFLPFWIAAEARNVSAMQELLVSHPEEQLTYQNHVRTFDKSTQATLKAITTMFLYDKKNGKILEKRFIPTPPNPIEPRQNPPKPIDTLQNPSKPIKTHQNVSWTRDCSWSTNLAFVADESWRQHFTPRSSKKRRQRRQTSHHLWRTG